MIPSIVVASALAGGGVGALLLFLAHIAPLLGAGNYIPDADATPIFATQLTTRERHLIGIALHMFVSVGFGAFFGLAVTRGWFNGFTVTSIATWSLAQWMFTCLVLMPLEGHGIFGRRHDSWFFFDSLVMSVLWGVLFWVVSRLWII